MSWVSHHERKHRNIPGTMTNEAIDPTDLSLVVLIVEWRRTPAIIWSYYCCADVEKKDLCQGKKKSNMCVHKVLLASLCVCFGWMLSFFSRLLALVYTG